MPYLINRAIYCHDCRRVIAAKYLVFGSDGKLDCHECRPEAARAAAEVTAAEKFVSNLLCEDNIETEEWRATNNRR